MGTDAYSICQVHPSESGPSLIRYVEAQDVLTTRYLGKIQTPRLIQRQIECSYVVIKVFAKHISSAMQFISVIPCQKWELVGHNIWL